MREETRTRLETLMTRYEKRLAEDRKRHETTRRRHDAFVGEFEQLIEDTIRPAMDEVGAALRRRGHDYEIATTEAYTDSDKRPRSTQVTMRFFPAGIDRALFTSTTTPYVAFVCNWLESRVTVRESAAHPGGAAKLPAALEKSGRRAEYYARQITPAAVEREIVEALAGVFGRGRVLDGR